MADPWNSSTAYSPFAVVSYNGLDYVRSVYPAIATSGTPPNEEMSTDSKGDPIRTWTLNPTYDPSPTISYFESYYFRLDFPDDPDFPGYAGLGYLAGSAYELSAPSEFGAGVTREYDQFTINDSPIPDNPVCPASKCGVARQFPTIGDVSWAIYTNEVIDEPRKYLVFLTFNHPLYFRRSFSIKYKRSATTTPKDPPGPPVTVISTISSTYIPDDRSFAEILPALDYYTSANSIMTIVIPEDVDEPEQTITYNLVSVAIVTDISPND